MGVRPRGGRSLAERAGYSPPRAGVKGGCGRPGKLGDLLSIGQAHGKLG